MSGIGRETHQMMLEHYSQTKNLLVLDVEPGVPEGFSLAAGEGLHFVTRSNSIVESLR